MKTLLVLLTTVLLLSGCGDDGTDAGDDPVSDDTASDGAGQTQPAGGTGAYAVATLDITVEHPEHDTVEYQLQCLGDTATVTGETSVDAEAACRALLDGEVVARLVDGPDPDQMCTEIYGGDDTAAITGTVDGTDVDATADRVNGCAIAAWDELLGDVLPPAQSG